MKTLKERQNFIEENRSRYTPERLLALTKQLNQDRARVYWKRRLER